MAGEMAAVTAQSALSLDTIRSAAHPVYPSELLVGCRSALILYAAGFLGANDGIHIHDAGIEDVTCVDTDPSMLGKMSGLYPPDWRYACGDAFGYLERATRTWDVISVDPPTNGSHWALLHTALCQSHATRAVIVGCTKEALDAEVLFGGLGPPWEQEGWRWWCLPRNDRVCWLVCERCDP